MLILTRKVGQTVRIGTETEIKVVNIYDQHVVLEIKVGPEVNMRKRGREASLKPGTSTISTLALGQALYLGNNIGLNFLALYYGQAKLGFDAPPHVSINRQEIYERIQAGVPRLQKTGRSRNWRRPTDAA